MDVGIKEWRVSFHIRQRMYIGFSYGQAWHGGAGAFHRHLFYSSSEHLEHPPPNLTHAAAAFVNTDGCLEDGDVGRDGGSGVGLGKDSGVGGQHLQGKGQWPGRLG